MKYYIIAGEASGDLHASNLMRGLYECDSKASVRFWGGDCMEQVFRQYEADKAEQAGKEGQAMEASKTEQAGKEGQAGKESCVGAGKAQDYREGAIMGVFELVGKLGMIASRLRFCKQDILRFNPDVLVLVDYPGFNLRIAKWASRKGIKVYYYIAPKVWASREGRIKTIRKYVDKLFIVFPFEKPYFDSKGLPYIYCGNPLVDAVDGSPAIQQTRQDFCALHGLDADKPIVAMLAGSRIGEIRTMTPLITGAAALLRKRKGLENCQFVLAGAPGRSAEDYEAFDKQMFTLVFGQTQQALHCADAALVNSGTASLEAALIGTPQVVAYRVASKATYYFAKWFLLKCKYISLGNLCLDKLAFKELYSMEDCTEDVVADELERLLTDVKYRETMLADYKAIRESLGGPGASERVAKAMIRCLKGQDGSYTDDIQ